MNSRDPIQNLKSIPLIGVSIPPGPIHTIQVDENDCIYYSDELNHAVVSLDSSGKVRWQAGPKGTNPKEFHYPRGLSLGRIMKDDSLVSCLGIADSWNRRIQFLGLDGEFLTEWRMDPHTSFWEPVDVRYVPLSDSCDPVSGGCWLILDKQNHRLWTSDCKGQVLRQIGTGIDPGMAAKWIASGNFPNLGKMDEVAPKTYFYDLLYYPDRMLGSKAEALFIWEPFRMILKLFAEDHFIPISLGSFKDRIWVAAGDSALVEWSPSGKCINTYDGTGAFLQSDPIDGVPIPSNLSANELWIQQADRLDRIQIIPRVSRRGLLLGSMAGKELKDLNAEVVSKSMDPVLQAVKKIIPLVDEVLDAKQKSYDADRSRLQEQLASFAAELAAAKSSLYSTLRRFNLGILMLRLACEKRGSEVATQLPPHAGEVRDRMMQAFKGILEELVRRREAMQALNQELQEAKSGDPETRTFEQQVLHELTNIINWLQNWTGSTK